MSLIETARLRLEPIVDRHFDGLQTLNADPEVMRYISGVPETPEQTRAMIVRLEQRWKDFGYAWWAVIEKDSGELIGMVGLQHLLQDRACSHEVGWRLRPSAWGKGFASEAAQAIVDLAFEKHGAPVVVAVAHQANGASQKVMQRVGMTYIGIQSHYSSDLATWSITRSEWQARR